MAFQASALPGLAAATTEMWPAMSNAMNAPWRVFARQKPSISLSKTSKRRESGVQTEIVSAAPLLSTRSELPDCLRDLPANFSSKMTPRISAQTSFGIRHTLAAIPKGTFAAANPIARRALLPSQIRQMSTGLFRSQFQKSSMGLVGFQKRALSGNNMSQSTLAHLEETANNNPNSATSQYAFYQALIRADMPAIIVERYETNQFASNTASDNLYYRALGMLGKNGSVANTNHFSGQNGNTARRQAVGQAVTAHSRGANIAISQGANTGDGAKEGPLHVLVQETIGGTIFKWFKFFAYFGLFTYLSLVVVSLIIETFQVFKKTGGKTDNEAKAEHQNVRFSDVHGCDEAKEELQELVDFLKSPEKFATLGGKLPKGVLLVGPPGTGKTLLARAVAGEAGVPFFFMSGSEFDEVYVGVGAKRVRELFAAAKGKQPAIVFIDELDAIGGKRNARDAAYVKQTLNQLLTELDGFEQNSGVIILAATNFPELLDKALTRPGRFDRNVVVGLPDVRGRMAILKHHMKNVTSGADVSLEVLAAATPGCSGAELENIINQAAVHASKAKAQSVNMLDFEWARDRVMWGAEKKGMFITPEEKETTAYHEAGHALVIMFTPGFNPLHKITILPRGQALGVTMHLPKMDKYSQGKDEYQTQLDVCLGGKVAEEIKYGADRVTSGVSSDLQKATQVAYAMVTMFGMSDKLGNVDLASNHDSLSAGTRELIESEVRRLIDEGRERAMKLLLSKRKELDLLAKALIEHETLDKDEAFKVIKGEKLDKKLILPSAGIKLPEVQTPISGGGMPNLPPIPGSQPEKPADKGPPAGGVVA
ncbi:probable AAA protease IAP-1 (mitochondrial intermembrane space) [Rhynchosporium secalis]|uniref:Probable AAA protease IAP-1 (Mitochondrial intermembrane space) n=1 Tax=Rhynchosporium secalis TaxID=38038 RepID=A0A1E1M7G5_RHYSE|nr:probable AAA protease IAP-1 (mitochondrial intermembrane space) [Rhynchosporium secalis]